MILKRDQNRKPSAGGISVADLLTPKTLLFDPVTNRLEVDVTIDLNPSSIVPTKDKRDGNRVPTSYGVSDVDLKTPLPILIDHNNSLIFVDILFT